MAEALDFPVELEQTGYEVRLAEPRPGRSPALLRVRKRFRRLFGPVRARRLRRYCDVNGRVLNGIPVHVQVLEPDAPAR